MEYPNLRVQVQGANKVRIEVGEGYQSRNEAVAHLFLEALRTSKYDLGSLSIDVYTGDRPPPLSGRKVAAFSSMSENVKAVPDFIFWNWPEVGIADYSDETFAIEQAGLARPSKEGLFWIGNTDTSPHRKTLLELAKIDRRIEAVDVRWIAGSIAEHHARDTPMATAQGNRVSLPDHCRYQYLIDIEGAGYSGRLKLLLFSGRPIFLQERPWREYFFEELTPYVHYIPVSRDLSDLSRALDWADAHPADCAEIAKNALDFAKRRLTRKAAVAQLQGELRKWVR